MAAPAFVGSSIVEPGTTWQTSYTLTSASLPAGTATGDLVLAFVVATYQSSPIGTQLSGGWGFGSPWIAPGPTASFTSGFQSGNGDGHTPQITCRACIYDSSSFPQTLVPKDATGATVTGASFDNWRILLLAYRTKTVLPVSSGWYYSQSGDTLLYGTGNFFDYPTVPAGGLTLGVGAFGGFTQDVSVYTANGFTERTAVPKATTNHHAAISHVDRENGTTDPGKVRWVRSGGSTGYGAAIFVSLAATTGGWSVGRIKY